MAKGEKSNSASAGIGISWKEQPVTVAAWYVKANRVVTKQPNGLVFDLLLVLTTLFDEGFQGHDEQF